MECSFWLNCLHCCSVSDDIFYKDFFQAPEYVPYREEKLCAKRSSKVKFHEEVRVKEIQAKNRGRSAKDVKMLSFGSSVDQADAVAEDEYDDSDGSSSDSDSFRTEHVMDDNKIPEDHPIQRTFDNSDRSTIERFKDDLFTEDNSESLVTSALCQFLVLIKRANNTVHVDMSTHETHVATIAQQIAELEAENIREKDWVLMGEATSKKRPYNSLLEEDLDFEQVQRPISSITTERVTSLEELIKRRILEVRFTDLSHSQLTPQ
jgi:U3 small nucleolar RNA-associated protein MPP10